MFFSSFLGVTDFKEDIGSVVPNWIWTKFCSSNIDKLRKKNGFYGLNIRLGIGRVGLIWSDIVCIPVTVTCYALLYTAQRSDNFIVGLTNVSPLISRPTLWSYTLCGQYPGAVPNGITVSLYCPYNLPPFRYVIVQFPIRDHMNFCELEVFASGTYLSISSLCCFTDWCSHNHDCSCLWTRDQ